MSVLGILIKKIPDSPEKAIIRWAIKCLSDYRMPGSFVSFIRLAFESNCSDEE
jgi:hypothetical protein